MHATVLSLARSPPRPPSPRVLLSSPSPPPCQASSSSSSRRPFVLQQRPRRLSSSRCLASVGLPFSPENLGRCRPCRPIVGVHATDRRGVCTHQRQQGTYTCTQYTLLQPLRRRRSHRTSSERKSSRPRCFPESSLIFPHSFSSSRSAAFSSSPPSAPLSDSPPSRDQNQLSVLPPSHLSTRAFLASRLARNLRVRSIFSSRIEIHVRQTTYTRRHCRQLLDSTSTPSSSSLVPPPSSCSSFSSASSSSVSCPSSFVCPLPFSFVFSRAVVVPPSSAPRRTRSFFSHPCISFFSTSAASASRTKAQAERAPSGAPHQTAQSQEAASSESTCSNDNTSDDRTCEEEENSSFFSPRSYKSELLSRQWPFMRAEMIRFFDAQNRISFDRIAKKHPGAALSFSRDPSVHLRGSPRRTGRKEHPGDEAKQEVRQGFQKEEEEEPGQGRHAFRERSFMENLVGSSQSLCSGVFSGGRGGGGGRTAAVNVFCREWERFVRKEDIQREGYVPCIVEKYGVERRLAIKRDLLEEIAFDEEQGHLSYLFQARLFRLQVGKWIEECVPTYVQADAVAKRLYFVKFQRHVPGKITEVDVPTTMVGLLACPAYQRGYHVELVMPTIRCQCVGEDLPLPFYVDVSKLHYQPPYKAITLRDLEALLPADGCTRFHPAYDLDTQEVAWTYEVGTLPEAPLPEEYVDPNFINRKQQKMDVMFHKQFPN